MFFFVVYNSYNRKKKRKRKDKKYSLKGVGLAPKRGSCSNGERPLPKSLAIFLWFFLVFLIIYVIKTVFFLLCVCVSVLCLCVCLCVVFLSRSLQKESKKQRKV